MTYEDDVSQEAARSMSAISHSISQARNIRGKTQAEIATACDMSIGTYQAVERGALTPTMRSYVKVLDYFGLSQTLRFVGAAIFDDEALAMQSRSSKNNSNVE